MRKFFKAFIDARQLQANYYVAQQLQRTKYREQTVGDIFLAINAGNLSTIKES